MRAFWTRTLALLTAALLALSLVVTSQSQYFCRMMERVMSARCCCSHDDDAFAQAPSRTPEIRSQNCCERVQGKHQKAAASMSDAGPRTPAPTLATIASFELSIEAPMVHLTPIEPRQARAPPAATPKLFLKNCSLLT